MIVDCHMHVWPDHIAQAMQAQRPAGMPLRRTLPVTDFETRPNADEPPTAGSRRSSR